MASRAGVCPRGALAIEWTPHRWRERFEYRFVERRAAMMTVRTLAIDDAARNAVAPQLVILGAGLVGRAWRMPELRDNIVFEVDHPDTQRDKRARASALGSCAREVRFVPVDLLSSVRVGVTLKRELREESSRKQHGT